MAFHSHKVFCGQNLPELLKTKFNVRKGLWLQSIRNSLPSVITLNVMPEDQADTFIAFHSGASPAIASSGLGPCTVLPVVSESSTVDFELGYGGGRAMKDSAVMILRATLSESADAFLKWKQRVVFDHEAMFPGMSKAFACQPSETSVILIAIFPQASTFFFSRTLMVPHSSAFRRTYPQ